ncbi:MAG: hypothetical protein K2X93_10835 [Candidatus Obscuribacterales bacterium]|nr:hypothetical protein [Candidatus Obscuribacterales bacterium]
MLQKLRLRQKGLLLVALPTLLVLVLISIPLHFASEAEQVVREEKRLRELLFEYNRLFNNSLNLLIQVEGMAHNVKEGTSLSSRDMASLRGYYDEIKENQERLANLSEDMSVERDALKKLNRSMTDYQRNIESSLMTGSFEVFRGPEDVQNFLDLLAKVRVITEQADERSRSQQERTRDEIGGWLWFGLTLDLVMAVVFLAYLNRDLKARVEHAKSNTIRIAANEPHLPPLTGADEISQFDRAICEMSDQLRILDENKHQFFAMITHDFRTPLSAVTLNLELLLLKHLPLDSELDTKSKEALAKYMHGMLSSAELLNSRVNRLLEFEKLTSGNRELEFSNCSSDNLLEKALEENTELLERTKVAVEVVWAGDEAIVYVDAGNTLAALNAVLSYAINQAKSAGKDKFRIISRLEKSTHDVKILVPCFETPTRSTQEIFDHPDSSEYPADMRADELPLLLAKIRLRQVNASIVWSNTSSFDRLEVVLPLSANEALPSEATQ